MKVRVFMSACILLFSSTIQAADHIWSKQGTKLGLVLGNEGVGHVKPLHAYSPDRSKQVQIDFVRGKDDAVPVATLIAGTQKFSLPLDKEWAQVEILWSPDSQDVALSGTFNTYTNSTEIFRLTSTGAELVPLKPIHMDMASTFPPCKAAKADPQICHAEQDGADFNYATIAWASATTAVIMAEVPCSSSQGGIMCEVEGYEIDVRTGQILRRMTARELKARWQSKLAWKLRIPDPPEWKPTR